MRSLGVIVLVAGAIRLATALDPGAATLLVALSALAAAGCGLWVNGRAAGRAWLRPWALVTAGLAMNLAGAVSVGLGGSRVASMGGLALVATMAGDVMAVGGLAVLLHGRMPGRVVETLAAAAVTALGLLFPLLMLVVVPDLGWHPGQQLPVLTLPALDLVVVWLALDVRSLNDRRPSGYSYLVAGAACLMGAHATTAALFLNRNDSSPLPLNAVLLWGACLWAVAVAHPSQRRPPDPVPLRSSRPGWSHVVLMIVAAMVTPSVLVALRALRIDNTPSALIIASALLPALVVGYLLHQVYARSAAEYRAQHDPLTGVCNRVLFNDRLDAALVEARRSGHGLGVMFLDLDRFKSINDSLGHAVGNQLLQAVVKRLQHRLRPEDTLARMGGDEFTVLFPEIMDKTELAGVGERILAAFAEPFQVGGKLMPVQTSIGLAAFPDDGEDSETLFKHADTAMYQAKAAGRNTYKVYSPAMSARAELRFALETSLRSTVESERLTVHYQPKLSTADGRVVGAEALARWKHPRLGYIPPSAFIPLAEETSLISTLGEWVLESACYQARAWELAGIPDLCVSVNVSPRQFARQSVVRIVADVLERTQLNPRLLMLEVTESLLIEHMEDTAGCLAELRSMGVGCSIDDFGTGYSGLTYLTDMPVDAIKIDPTFTRRIDSESGTAAIVGAVIELAHTLGLRVTAEGVETLDQFRFLVDHGCDLLQGYLISRPLPADEFQALLLSGRLLVPDDEDDVGAGAPAAGAPVLSGERLEAVLAGAANAAPSREWTEGLEREDLLTVLAALQSEDVVPVVGPRGIRLVPARMAVGTLAGLASVTGSLSAVGMLPAAAAQQVARDILQGATGLSLPGGGAPDGAGPGLVADGAGLGGGPAGGAGLAGGAAGVAGAGVGLRAGGPGGAAGVPAGGEAGPVALDGASPAGGSSPAGRSPSVAGSPAGGEAAPVGAGGGEGAGGGLGGAQGGPANGGGASVGGPADAGAPGGAGPAGGSVAGSPGSGGGTGGTGGVAGGATGGSGASGGVGAVGSGGGAVGGRTGAGGGGPVGHGQGNGQGAGQDHGAGQGHGAGGQGAGQSQPGGPDNAQGQANAANGGVAGNGQSGANGQSAEPGGPGPGHRP
ncbi:MAG TPA: EAL domain-containing protein [Acidimicrobiales bacterium]|nr:EAL domain-containing protein [Acidimicrobiales bacterium]